MTWEINLPIEKSMRERKTTVGKYPKCGEELMQRHKYETAVNLIVFSSNPLLNS